MCVSVCVFVCVCACVRACVHACVRNTTIHKHHGKGRANKQYHSGLTFPEGHPAPTFAVTVANRYSRAESAYSKHAEVGDHITQ